MMINDRWNWSSSRDQLKDEMNQLYRRMTDPVERDKARLQESRQDTIKSMQADYGL